MTQVEFVDKCVKVDEFWGLRMPMMAMEEAGEFIQAISKMQRALDEGIAVQQKNDKEVKNASLIQIGKRRKELSEEIGDMYISLMAIMNHYGVTCEEVNEYVDKKLSKKY